MDSSPSTLNTQLVESLLQVIYALPAREQALLLDKLLSEIPIPSTVEMMHLAEQGGAFDFWQQEPDLYTLEDGEAIAWQ